METENLYNLARYYDIAFTREIHKEVDFFAQCFGEYSPIKVKTVLEPACGTGMHMIELCKHGYRVTGYDLNSSMVTYTNQELAKAGCKEKAEVVEGDMRTMRFKNKFDAAINVLSSISYCLTDEDVANHFQVTAKSLKKGAVYIVEFKYGCDDIKHETTPDETWFAEREGTKVTTTWCPDRYDKEKKIRHITVHMKVEENGKNFVFQEDHNLRLWNYEDLVKLSKQAGFVVKAIYNQKFEKLPADAHISGEAGVLYHVLVNAGQ